MYRYFSYAALLFTTLSVIITICSYTKNKSEKESRLHQLLIKSSALLEQYLIVVLFLIFAVFLCSRLLLLGKLPMGIHVDEVGMAYDAKSLIENGMDRHHVRMPVYLQNFGGGQSALYAYLTGFIIKVAGFSVRNIRLTAVICAIPCFFCSYLILKELFHSRKIALMGPILVTVIPVFMISERWALDCNLFLSFATVAFYFFIKAVNDGRKRFYLLAGIFFGITLDTYIISYMVLPLFLILASCYLIYVKKLEIKKMVLMAIPLCIVGIPLLLFQLVSMGILPEFTFLFSDFKRLPGYRGGEISFSNVLANLNVFKKLTISGEPLSYNCLPKYGPLYLFSFPLLIYGITVCIKDLYESIKKREYKVTVPVLLFFFAALFMAMIIFEPNINKTNEIYLPFVLFIAIAAERIFSKRKAAGVLILFCYMLAFLSFSNYYFRVQKQEYGLHELFFDTQFGDAITYLNQHYNVNGRTVYLSIDYDDVSQDELMTGLYGNVPLSEFHEEGPFEGQYYLGLPENFTLEEDSLYIIGENWGHVTSYLADNGFTRDDTFSEYTILYRDPK
ncbi:MAG: glycosyltransferase family 39 protein [Clostridia bacterium]|nr:glycosyltransferase family 39 protein [Clostridia bacterium]